jgi:hypothetical protein
MPDCAPALARRWLLLGALLLAAGASAWAHRPLFSEVAPSGYGQALEIREPEVSQVFYSRLDPASPRTWFVFTGGAGRETYLSLGVPVLERLRAFRPKLALLGPGLPPVELPFDLPAGVGGMVFEAAGEPRFFHEPVTGTDSWILLEATVRLPVSGRFYVVAFPDQSPPTGDKLWLSIGTRERFGLRELLGLGRIKRFVREFHEKSRAQ